jgi:hypothetical protein
VLFGWDAGEPSGIPGKYRLPAFGPQAVREQGPPRMCSKKGEGLPVGCYHLPNRLWVMLHVVSYTD